VHVWNRPKKWLDVQCAQLQNTLCKNVKSNKC
jgi:hypothetical protein